MKKYFILLLLISITAACGGREFKKNPVDEYIKSMENATTFSIILYDMNVSGTFFKSYLHQYKIVKEVNGDIKEETTGWKEVPKEFFFKNENNMGMEIASKNAEGKVSKIAAPPGYRNYVGNDRYGYWSNGGGSSFWVFYGQYAMMRNLLGWGSYRMGRDSWSTYNTGYRGKRPYYGTKTSTGTTFGTRSTFSKKTNPTSSWNRKLEQRRVNRSSSRYSSRSSRSRSGGFGK